MGRGSGGYLDGDPTIKVGSIWGLALVVELLMGSVLIIASKHRGQRSTTYPCQW
jgi:hypothetical protein